ncbi:MAG: glycosyltransferase family 39 protein [Sulfuriferula sp.]|nr:glycosyltransferase family 39 protein [Sulfuriferula sp.]
MFALTAVLWFATLDHNALVRPDEGRYAEIPREMVASGDWTTPRLNSLKYFEKPALQYWATAVAYTAFGEHNWTARLWAALTGFLGILLVYFTGLRIYNRRAGFIAAMVLASSFLYFAIGHINILDMGVSFFMSLSLAALLLAQRPDANESETRWWMYVCWAGMGLSMLSKGLIGVAIPGAVLILYSLIQRDWGLWKRLHMGTGLLIFAAITVPWFVLVSRDNPEFLWFFFVHEHILRYLTPISGRVHPWYTFIPVVLLGILPWLLPMLHALGRGWERRPTTLDNFQVNRMLMVWTGFIFLFFSVSHSKLIPYILPIFPALALLIGDRLSKISGKALAWQFSIVIPLAIAAWWFAPLAIRSASAEVPAALYENFVPWIQGAALCWLIGVLIAMWLARREQIITAVSVMAVAGLLMGQSIYIGYNALSPASSAYLIAQQVKPYLKPGVPFYSVAMYEQTLPPYLQRTMTLVAHPDEMEFGIEQEPHKWIPDIATFLKLWRQQPYALAVMSPVYYQQFAAQGLPMRVIARDTRRVVVVTP